MATDHRTTRIDALRKQLTGKLEGMLAHRKLLGAEPKPWEQAAADFWGIEERGEEPFPAPGDVRLCVRKVQPFVVLRKRFEVPAGVIDAHDPWPDGACADVAAAAAGAEVRAVFYQQPIEEFDPNLGGFDGILGNPASGHADSHPDQQVGPPVKDHLKDAVGAAVLTIRNAGIDGPFAVLLPTEAGWSPPVGATDVKAVNDLAAKGIHKLPGLRHGCVLSTASGNYQFLYGGGWRLRHLGRAGDGSHHEFVLEESLAFRVLKRKAAVRLVA